MRWRRRQHRGAVGAALQVAITASLLVSTASGADILLSVDEEELLVLTVEIEKHVASEALIGYHHDGRVLLPLGELATALEYSIVSIPERGVVEGWMGDEDMVFRLDLQAASLTVDGEERELAERCAYVNEYDVYVTTEVLSRWWPLDIEADLRRLRIDLAPREPVPLLERLERRREWNRFQQGRAGGPAEYPRTSAPYRLATWPFLDAEFELKASDDGEEGRGSVLGRGDLARLSATGFLGWTSRRDDKWRGWLRAGRSDHEADLLGPLRATAFQVGDVSSVALPLAGISQRGRGMTITNRDLGSTTQFDAVDINGDAPPGWEVELYLNGTLRDIQIASEDGYYRFEQVPLHVGLNTVRTVLYGPSGQTREDVRTYNIRSGMRRTGTLQYDLSSIQAGTSLFGKSDAEIGPVQSGQWQHQLALRYGLSPTTTVGAAFTRAESDTGSRQIAIGEIYQSLGPALLQTAVANDLDAGVAGRIGLQSLWRQRSFSVGYERYDDYPALSRGEDGHLSSRMTARVTGKIGGDRRSAWNYRAAWERGDYTGRDIDHLSRYELYIGGQIGRINLGNGLQYLRTTGSAITSTTAGQAYVAGHASGTRISGSLGYKPADDDVLQNVGVSLSRAFTHRLRGSISGHHSIPDGGRSSLNGRVDWDLKPVRLGLRAGVSDHDWNIGLTASTSLSRAPEGIGWRFSNRRLTTFGAALVQTFIDRNADGVYDSGDDPLPGVGFHGNRLWKGVRTVDDGQAFLPGIPADKFVNVDLDVQSVPDPYLVPVHRSMTTLVHAGGISDLEFPWHYVGEIEGVVARDQNLSRPLRNLGLELVGEDGQREASTVSEYDGYYLFQEIPPGDYEMKVVESTLRGQELVVPDPVPISVPEGGGFVPGPSIVLVSPQDLPDEVFALEDSEPPEEPTRSEVVDAEPSTPVADTHTRTDVDRSGVSVATGRHSAPDPSLYETGKNRRTMHLVYEMLFESGLIAKR